MERHVDHSWRMMNFSTTAAPSHWLVLGVRLQDLPWVQEIAGDSEILHILYDT